MLRAALLAFACLTATGAVARADGDVGVVVVGEPTMQKPAQAIVQAWLEQHSYTYVTAAMTSEARSALLNCLVIEDMSCARGAFENRSKATNLVFARVELQTGHEVSVTAYWFAKGHDAIAEKRWCKKCNDAALRDTLDELMPVLEKNSGANQGHLQLHSKPDGVEVFVDDVAAGVTPLERDLSVGAHRIELRKKGKPVGSKQVKIEAGGVAEVTIAVVETAAVAEPAGAGAMSAAGASEPADNASGKQLKLYALLAGGAGVALLATGGVFFYYGHKGGPDAPLIYPSATRDGWIFAGVGVGALAAAGYLWWRRSSAHGSGAPTAMIDRSGAHSAATFGWAVTW
jgi:hypothetical protein